MSLPVRARVALSAPLRAYLAHAPTQHGRRPLLTILRHLLPPAPASFEMVRPGGARVRVLYREALGLAELISGFERNECETMRRYVRPGSAVIDVGANVGAHALPLAQAAAPGMLIAIEPLSGNAQRLRENARASGISNIVIVQKAAGPDVGRVTIMVTEDAAYASVEGSPVRARQIGSVEVEQTTLDEEWIAAGAPPVSLIKIDVEGAEIAVLAGGQILLERHQPAVVAEANDPGHLEMLDRTLAKLGYSRRDAVGFEPWNHLFLADRNSSSGLAGAHGPAGVGSPDDRPGADR